MHLLGRCGEDGRGLGRWRHNHLARFGCCGLGPYRYRHLARCGIGGLVHLASHESLRVCWHLLLRRGLSTRRG